MQALAKPELKLAGIKLNPKNFSRSRVRNKYTALSFKAVDGSKSIEVDGLGEGIMRSPQWSSDSRYLSFVWETPDSATLWFYDIENQALQQLSDLALNSVVAAKPYQWLPDASGVIINHAINADKQAPEDDASTVVPVIQQTTGKKHRPVPIKTCSPVLMTKRYSSFTGKGCCIALASMARRQK